MIYLGTLNIQSKKLTSFHLNVSINMVLDTLIIVKVEILQGRLGM